MLTLIGLGAAAASGCKLGPNYAQGSLERLESLPYLIWVEIDPATRDLHGVVVHAPERADPGLNFFNSRPRSRAVLIDMDGHEVHSWRGEAQTGWHHIELAPDGSIFAIERDVSISKIDWASNRLWKRAVKAHHDVALAPDGGVYVLTRAPGEIVAHGRSVPILEDFIEQLSPRGETIRRIAMSKLFGDRVSVEAVEQIARALERDPRARPEPETVFDVFHANTIELLDDGQALVAVRNLDLVAVIDLATRAVIWEWGPGELDRPHDPTLLENGHMLIFDNGMHRGYSRVVEVDTSTSEIVWEYAEGPDGSFYSAIRGGAQLLPNGDVLITESDRGRAFEVTREGDVVWEYYNPDVLADRRAPIYRLKRVKRGALPSYLAGH